MKRIGMPTSDDTILRCLKRRVKARVSEETTRVVGVDDWAWRKGSTYRTIIVDLWSDARCSISFRNAP